MKQINNDRVEEFDLIADGKKFPFTKINPLKESSTLVLFSLGLNSNSNFIKYLDYPCFDNVYLICYDARAQSKNELKPSIRFETYIDDMNSILTEYLKQNPNIKKVYIIGESWGSALAFLYKKKYPEKIYGVMGWNMPYEIIDTSKSKNKNLMLKLKVLVTLLTTIDTNGMSILSEDTTNNKAIKKLITNSRKLMLSNKVVIASWKSFKRSWRYFLRNPNEKFLYVQSGEDNMRTKILFKNGKTYKNVINMEKGTHLLSFDINVADQLFDIVKDFLNK